MATYTVGWNFLPIIATDILGAPQTVTTGWSATGNIGDGYGTTLTATNSNFSYQANGVHYLAIYLPTAGTGYISISNTDPAIFISPNVYDLSIDSSSNGEIYNLINRTSLEASSVSISNYETISSGPYKVADDVVIDYTVPFAVTPSLVGWTALKASVRPATALVGDVASLGDFTVTVLDDVNNRVRLVLSRTVTATLVTTGQLESTFYSDLQGIDGSGNYRTLAEFSMIFRRQFTTT